MKHGGAGHDFSGKDYTAQGRRVFERHADPGARPETGWNTLTTPAHASIYER